MLRALAAACRLQFGFCKRTLLLDVSQYHPTCRSPDLGKVLCANNELKINTDESDELMTEIDELDELKIDTDELKIDADELKIDTNKLKITFDRLD